MSKAIIDVSHWQAPKNIDYATLCKQLEMAIVRVQYGSAKIDKYFDTHIAQFKKRNVPFGVYAFVRGVNTNDMKNESTTFYQRCKKYDPSFFVLDVEEISMSDMRTGVKAYVKRLRECTNKKIGVYVAHHLYKKFNLEMNDFDFVWLPHYGTNTGSVTSKPSYYSDLHQYTEKGRLKGYSGFLDLNRFMNNRTTEFFTGENVPDKITDSEETTYKIKAGDTLSGIAKKYGVTVTDIANHNGIKNVNLIYVGDILSIPGKGTSVVTHKVKKNETLTSISKRYGVTINKLVELNNIKNPDIIYVGDIIRLR